MRPEVQARRYIVSGRVQGVGFRNYVEHVAGKLEVNGYVRNRRDGSVEVFAISTSDRLSQLRFALEKGPTLARVLGVQEQSDHPDERYLGNFIIEITV